MADRTEHLACLHWRRHLRFGHCMSTRYIPEGSQAAFEPGSRGRVLANKLGVRSVRLINAAESFALQIAQD